MGCCTNTVLVISKKCPHTKISVHTDQWRS